MSIRTVIVDDEPLAREGIAMILADAADVRIVAQCANGAEAIRAIREQAPELVFLDIRMPGLSGFDVVESIGPEAMPAVVFLTAYEEHAIRAFRVNALDYLLKPLDSKQLHQALDRVRDQLSREDALRRTERLTELLGVVGSTPDPEKRIVVRSTGHVYFLEPDEITWVEAAGDYVTIHTTGKSHLVRDSMKNMEARLAEFGFQRIHRSTLVNLRCIRELVANDSGDYQVILREGTACRLSRRYRDALYARLEAGLHAAGRVR
jgi:two-component system LytT family response regulator